MNSDFGKLINEFDTNLSNVFFRRLSWYIIPPLAAAVGFTIAMMNDERLEDANTALIIAIIVACFVLAAAVFTGSVFLRRMYKAEVYEKGLVLTNKTRNKIQEIGFEQIENIRELDWVSNILFIVPAGKSREVEIHFTDRRRLSIRASNLRNVEGFGAALAEAFDRYRNTEKTAK